MSRARKITLTGIAAGLLLFGAANAHLVYVALKSQPACVEHSLPGEPAPHMPYAAAQSACTPTPFIDQGR